MEGIVKLRSFPLTYQIAASAGASGSTVKESKGQPNEARRETQFDKRCPTARVSLVRVFSDVLVAFLYFDICHFVSGKYQNMEKLLKHQRRLRLGSHRRSQGILH